MTGFNHIRVGLIGFGVGKLYAAALRSLRLYYPDMPEVELIAVATASEESGKRAVDHFGFKWHTMDYQKLLASDDINVVVIATPTYLHHEMLINSLETEKAIYMDKPIAMNLAEAHEILTVAKKNRRDAQMIFEFRFCPALQYAHNLIQQGRLGDIYAFRAVYYRSSYCDVAKPLRWKGELDKSGGGVLNDYAPHLIDLMLWLIGMPDQLTAQTRTFIHERPREKDKAGMAPIETDDHLLMQMSIPGGAIGTIEAGRLIHGAVNEMVLEIYSSRGSLSWNLMDPNYLSLAEEENKAEERGWTKIPTVQRYPDAAIPGADLPVGMMRFHIASMADFIRNTLDGKPYDPGLEQGARVQSVIEAAAVAARTNSWVDISKL